MSASSLPLAGVRVVEFVRKVMGPTCGPALAPTWLPDGRQTLAPLLLLAWDGDRRPNRSDPPNTGEHTVEILRSAGLTTADIDELAARGVAAVPWNPQFAQR